MNNINPVNISIFCYEQAYKKFIHIGRRFGWSKRQLEISLRIFSIRPYPSPLQHKHSTHPENC